MSETPIHDEIVSETAAVDPTVGEDENPPLPPGENPNSDGVTVDGDIDESVADDSDGDGEDDDAQATAE